MGVNGTSIKSVRNEYDVLRPGRLRRTPRVEQKGEGGIYSMAKRVKGANVGRDLERNFSPAKSIINQFRMCVVGSLGKLRLNVENGDEATKWFNEVWAKDCDFRDSMHFSEYLQNVVAATLREGDLLSVFDDDLIEDTGKLLNWEADQIAPVSDGLLKTAAWGLPADAVQDNGIVRDKWGRVLGYIASGKRGMSVISDKADATFWRRENAILPRNPWRLNQGRGVPCIITAASSLIDLYEMLMRELQTAKRAAADYALIKRKDAVDDWDAPGTMPEVLPENYGKTAAEVADEGANSDTNPENANYENLGEFVGGMVDFGEPGDEIAYANTDRPNVHMPEFIEAVHCYAASAFGLARTYALLKASSSYTAFRGEMILTWQGAFYPIQKWLERRVADWCGINALTWAQRKKIIGPLQEGWQRKLSWQWPKMPEVDELDAAKAVAQALKNGTTDYSELLGPDWAERMESLADQLDHAREMELPLGIFEVPSGKESETAERKKDE